MRVSHLVVVLICVAFDGSVLGRVNWTHVRLRMDTLRGTCPDFCEGKRGLSPSEMDEKEFLTSSCFCDEDCGAYGDCCLDMAQENMRSQTEDSTGWVCESLASAAEPLHVYMMGACPVDWLDHQVNDLCRRGVERSSYSFHLDVPVFSFVTNITYVNIFCAQCHGDAHSLMPVTVRFNCPLNETNCKSTLERGSYYPKLRHWSIKSEKERSYGWFYILEHEDPRVFLKRYTGRRCRPVIDSCDRGESDDDVVSDDLEGCPAFSSYTYEWADAAIAYKNPLCAICQDDLPERLECNWESMPKHVHSNSRRRQFSSRSITFFTQHLDFKKVLSGEEVANFLPRFTENDNLLPKPSNVIMYFLSTVKAVFKIIIFF